MIQVELAEKNGVSSKTISMWDTAKGLPDLLLLQPLSHFGGISVIKLMNGKHINNQNISANILSRMWKSTKGLFPLDYYYLNPCYAIIKANRLAFTKM